MPSAILKSVLLRNGRLDDADDVCEIEYYAAESRTFEVPWTRGEYRAAVKSRTSSVYVADSSGEVRGWVSVARSGTAVKIWRLIAKENDLSVLLFLINSVKQKLSRARVEQLEFDVHEFDLQTQIMLRDSAKWKCVRINRDGKYVFSPVVFECSGI